MNKKPLIAVITLIILLTLAFVFIKEYNKEIVEEPIKTETNDPYKDNVCPGGECKGQNVVGRNRRLLEEIKIKQLCQRK